MRKYFNLKSITLFLSISFFMSSCNDDDKKNDDTTNSPASTTTATTTNTETAQAPQKAAVTGTFDNLYIEREAFDTLLKGTKMVFCHTFAADDKVHLDGWVLNGNTFDTPPNMPLKNGTPSSENYGAGTYFGNVVLHSASFNKIKNALKDATMKYVLFKPKKVDTYHIGYDIYVSPTPSFTFEANFLATTDANPSPPRNY